MQKIIAVMLAYALTVCSGAFASSTGSGAPYEDAAEAMTMLHFLTMENIYGEENCEPYLMTKPLYHPEQQMIEYATNNRAFQIVMFCDETGSGIIQIHLLFTGDIDPYEAYVQLLGLILVYRRAHMQAGNESPDVDLVMILTEALEQPDSGNPWESRVVTLNDAVDIVAYRNGVTYAFRLDFRQPITAEYLDTEMLGIVENLY